MLPAGTARSRPCNTNGCRSLLDTTSTCPGREEVPSEEALPSSEMVAPELL